jgi:hypothetical protein
MLIGEIVILGGGAAEPSIGTVIDPALVAIVRLSVNVPIAVGEKLTVAEKLVLGCITNPLAGVPVAANGAAGDVTVCTLSGFAPVLEKITELLVVLPTATPPKLTDLGLAVI